MSESPLTNLRLVSYIQGSAEHQPQIISKILLGDFSDANMQSQVKNQSTGYPLNSNSSSEKEAEEKVVSNLS